MARRLSRRSALKGLGVSVALPLLEAMLPSTAGAAPPAAASVPRRLVFLYFPNGVNTQAWKSTGEGRDFELGKTLAKDVLAELQGGPAKAHDASTAGLIERVRG